MKKSILMKAILTSFLMAFIVTPEVMSETVGVGSIDGYWVGLGGEFTLYPSAGLQGVLSGYVEGKTKNIQGDHYFTGPNFQSFCIEHGEDVYDRTTYNVTISDGAIAGGVGGPNPDPISVGTAWLYHLFQGGILTGYNYTPGNDREDSADELQYTIWWLEEEEDDDPENIFSAAVIAKFGSAANAMADNNGQYPVSALNLYDLGGGLSQDLLVCDPIHTPEPATMLLLGSGLIGLAGLARKRFKK